MKNSFMLWQSEDGGIFLGESMTMNGTYETYMKSQGYILAGKIETDLSRAELENGIGGPAARERDRLLEKMNQIRAVINTL